MKRFLLLFVMLVFGASAIVDAQCDFDISDNNVKDSFKVQSSLLHSSDHSSNHDDQKTSHKCSQHVCSFCVHNVLITQQVFFTVIDENLRIYNLFKESFYQQDFFLKLKRPPRA